MYKSFLAFIVIYFSISCKEFDRINVQTIIDKSIEVSGGDKIKNSIIDFDFRDKHYKATRNNGLFQFERVFKDSVNIAKDVLSNNGYRRYINHKSIVVVDSMVPRYSSSINSVHYFSILPYGLNDQAVNKEYLEKVELKASTYHKIKVTFNEEGGGEDFEDVFIYWIDVNTFKAHYIAYSYSESHGLGLRFRESYNERYVNGIRFVDYNNFKPRDDSATLENLGVLFEKDKLKLLSKIELKNITVN